MTTSLLSLPMPFTGADATNAELLEVLAGEDAAELYRKTGRLREVLVEIETHALDPLTRARLLALRTLHERLAAEPPTGGNAISTPADAARLFAHLSMLDHEEFWVAYVTRANTVLGTAQIASGGPAHVEVSTHQIFRGAIRRMAPAILVAHSHPSGVTMPSDADRQLTTRLVAAGNELAIQVLDHLILAPGAPFYSFAAAGAMSSVRS